MLSTNNKELKLLTDTKASKSFFASKSAENIFKLYHKSTKSSDQFQFHYTNNLNANMKFYLFKFHYFFPKSVGNRYSEIIKLKIYFKNNKIVTILKLVECLNLYY